MSLHNCEKGIFAWNNLVPTGWAFIKFGYLGIFLKSVEEILGSVRSDKNNGYFTERPIYIFLSYLVQLFLE